MKLSNINKPTSPFWNKVALACASASAFIAGYGALADDKNFMIAGGILGILGTIIPIFISNGEN
jgi:hypothetical protein